MSTRRIGAEFAIRQHVQLLVLEMVRAYAYQAELPPGWLRVLTDERLRPAIGLMHADPGKPSGLDELARAAAMSRTSFAERFRTVAGVPPLAYLGRWRMLLAQQALRDDDVRVGALASKLDTRPKVRSAPVRSDCRPCDIGSAYARKSPGVRDAPDCRKAHGTSAG